MIGSKAFGGRALRSSRLVRLIYLDEAGISNPAQEPYVVVAGLAVNADKEFKAVEAHLDGLARKYLPAEKLGHVAFHTMELFHGTKNFDRSNWPLYLRLEILDELAEIPKKFDLPICWGSTVRKDIPNHLSQPASPLLLEQIGHGHAFFKFVVQIEILMRATASDEVAMLIAEDRPIMRRMLKVAHGLLRGRAPPEFRGMLDEMKGEDKMFEILLPLERIVETIHFVQKAESSVLQLADLCAFAIKRSLMKSAHYEKLLAPIQSQILFTPEALTTPSSTVKPS
jgi:hypothetical protein